MVISRKKRFEDDSYYHGAFRWMGVGFEFCVVVVFFCLIGYFLDKIEPATKPGWLIVGFFVGFGVMLYMMIKRAKKDENSQTTDNEDQNSAD